MIQPSSLTPLRPILAPKAAGESISFTEDKTLGEQGYRLACDGEKLVISGGSPVAELSGAYAFVEKLGVRRHRRTTSKRAALAAKPCICPSLPPV